MSDLAYIYLLQDGHDKGTRVYKIGRTVQKGGDSRKLDRLQAYSNGTMVYYLWKVNVTVVNAIKTAIKQEFKQHFRIARGYEWFEGDVKGMNNIINTVIDLMDVRETYTPSNPQNTL